MAAVVALLLFSSLVVVGVGGSEPSSTQSVGTLEQSASISPDDTQTFAPGGTYPVVDGAQRVQANGTVDESEPPNASVDLGVPKPPTGYWPDERFDTANTGAAENATPPRPIDSGWRFDVERRDGNGSMPVETALGTDDVVVAGVGHTEGEEVYDGSIVFGIDRETGETRWESIDRGSSERHVTDIQITGDTAVIVYVEPTNASNRELVGLDVETGEKRWQKERIEFTRWGVTALNETVYFQTRSSVHALDTETGETEWTAAPEEERATFSATNGPLALTNDTVFSVADCEVPESGTQTGCAVAVDRATGTVRWVEVTTHRFMSRSDPPIPVVADGSLYVSVDYSADTDIVQFDAVTGEVLANETFNSGDSAAKQAVTSSRLITNEGVYSRTGFNQTASLPFDAQPLVVGDVAIGVAGGEVAAHDLSSGKRIESVAHESGGTPDRITAVANGTVVTVDDGQNASVLTFDGPTESGFDVDPEMPAIDEPATFEATVDATTFGWDFDDDGEVDAYGETVEHTFERSGTRDVSIVTDPDGADSQRYVESVTVTEPVVASLEPDERYPESTPTTVTVSAANSSGTGDLEFEWTDGSGEALDCGETCDVAVEDDQPVEVSVTATDQVGETDTTSVEIVPVDVGIGLTVDGTPQADLYFDEDVLVEETVSVEAGGTATLDALEVDGVGAATGDDSVQFAQRGEATITATLDVDGVDEPVTRTVTLRVHEYQTETDRIEYEADSRKTRVGVATMQPDVELLIRNIEQRVGDLPASIDFDAVEDASDVVDSPVDRSGYADHPDRVVIETARGSGSSGNPGALSTTEHELVHLAQFEMDMEPDGDWNYLLEGHATFEASTRQPYSIYDERLDRTDLLDWGMSGREYDHASDFVSAFYAEYGRQTFLDLVENTDDGDDMRSRFASTTGESFDDFYDRWEGTDDDPGRDRQDVTHRVSFHYADGRLVADGDLPTIGPSMVDVEWDITGDGTFNLSGHTVDWAPTESGEYAVTVAYESGDSRIEQTQRFHVGPDDVPDGEFIVTGLSASDPVTEGDTLSVEAAVDNTEDVSATQTIELVSGDGSVLDETSLSLDENESDTVSFEWDTERGDAGTHALQVRSDDDVSSLSVEVRSLTIEPALDVSDATPYNTETVTLDASEATAFVDGTEVAIDAFRWDLGDGTTETTDDPVLEHRFDDAGTYNVSVEFVVGNASETYEKTVAVEHDDRPPTITDLEVEESRTNDSATVRATVEPTGAALASVELGLNATFAPYTETVSVDDVDPGTVEATIHADALVADGNYTAFVEAVDEHGNVADRDDGRVDVDTTPPKPRATVEDLGQDVATLTLEADEPLDLTDLEIVAEGAESVDRTPSSYPTRLEDPADELTIEFEGGLVDGVNTTYSVSGTVVDDAGNGGPTALESTISGYEIENGTASLVSEGGGYEIDLAVNASAIGNDTVRQAVLTESDEPPASTTLDSRFVADGYLNVVDDGLTDAELENATLLVSLSDLDPELTDDFDPADLVVIRSPDGEPEYQPISTDYTGASNELVATVDGFSQFAVAGVDETPPIVENVTVDPGTDIEPGDGPVTVSFEYSPSITPIDVEASVLAIEGADEGIDRHLTDDRARVDLSALEDGDSVTVTLTLVDTAGNEVTAEESITVGGAGGGLPPLPPGGDDPGEDEDDGTDEEVGDEDNESPDDTSGDGSDGGTDSEGDADRSDRIDSSGGEDSVPGFGAAATVVALCVTVALAQRRYRT
ncbi:PKD domain-containing protein [Halovivax cerinus]|uniref:PKD domain-containing protein n=1 Tax=Halovivax cerinus TaxID=1487865 RepID=A0ABD5NJZ2_9EURY|nr:PKD domain-containing protein [Halovivax cerinus]